MLYYLASPYAAYHLGKEAAAKEAARIAALLLDRGMVVYSPITHSHQLAHHMDNHTDHEFWLRADIPFMEASRELIIAPMEGWRASRGIRFEVEWFDRFKRIDPYLLNLARLSFERLPAKEIRWEGGALTHPIDVDKIN